MDMKASDEDIEASELYWFLFQALAETLEGDGIQEASELRGEGICRLLRLVTQIL